MASPAPCGGVAVAPIGWGDRCVVDPARAKRTAGCIWAGSAPEWCIRRDLRVCTDGLRRSRQLRRSRLVFHVKRPGVQTTSPTPGLEMRTRVSVGAGSADQGGRRSPRRRVAEPLGNPLRSAGAHSLRDAIAHLDSQAGGHDVTFAAREPASCSKRDHCAGPDRADLDTRWRATRSPGEAILHDTYGAKAVTAPQRDTERELRQRSPGRP